MNEFKIEKSWSKYLKPEFAKDYMLELYSFLKKERAIKSIFPEDEDMFNAFSSTPFDKVKVVILGQDPYHGEGQAHGLSFSVKEGVKIPPSLANIYKELKMDLDIDHPGHGNLESWAKEGVLLLNSVLTVEKASAGSHRKKGWEKFTDKVIEVLNEEKENLVFVLWGAPAQKKGCKIDKQKHLVLTAPHPSPLSSYRGFFGCKHFSRVNEYLESKEIELISWNLII